MLISLELSVTPRAYEHYSKKEVIRAIQTATTLLPAPLTITKY